MSAKTVIPDVPEVTDPEVAFSTIKHLPKWTELTDDEKNERGPFCHAVSMLFFNGGRFSDYGLTAKPGVDVPKVVRLVQSHLQSFEPKHEHKIGGIAHLLAQWFDANEAVK